MLVASNASGPVSPLLHWLLHELQRPRVRCSQGADDGRYDGFVPRRDGIFLARRRPPSWNVTAARSGRSEGMSRKFRKVQRDA